MVEAGGFAARHRRNMGTALAAARRAAVAGEAPVGAALYLGEKLLFTARNRMQATGDATAHAEMLILRRLARHPELPRPELSLYVTLEPCAMCAGAIILCRIGMVIWGADDPRYGAGGSAFSVLGVGLPAPQPELVRGVREEECRELLRTFFGKLRKS